MRPSPADIDRRKARIVACLYPTRIGRGIRTADDCKVMDAKLEVGAKTVRRWENGNALPKDSRLPAIERWLASGPVWRYDRINHVVGPESWPEPLGMACSTARQKAAETPELAFRATLGVNPVPEVGSPAVPTLIADRAVLSACKTPTTYTPTSGVGGVQPYQ